MVSLLDIVPQTRVVTIADGELTLRGLGLRRIADLLVRYPELRTLLAEGAAALDVDAMIAAVPDAVGAIVAEAAGEPEAADTIANSMALDDIVDCLQAVVDMTMPRGPVPFMAGLGRLLGGAVVPTPRTASDTISPPPPSS